MSTLFKKFNLWRFKTQTKILYTEFWKTIVIKPYDDIKKF